MTRLLPASTAQSLLTNGQPRANAAQHDWFTPACYPRSSLAHADYRHGDREELACLFALGSCLRNRNERGTMLVAMRAKESGSSSGISVGMKQAQRVFGTDVPTTKNSLHQSLSMYEM